jgi:hypothetical protein
LTSSPLNSNSNRSPDDIGAEEVVETTCERVSVNEARETVAGAELRMAVVGFRFWVGGEAEEGMGEWASGGMGEEGGDSVLGWRFAVAGEGEG